LPATAFARAGPGLDSLDAHGYERILRRSRFGVEGSRILNNGTIIDAGCRLDDPEVWRSMKKSATGRPLPDLTRARRALTPLVRLIDGFFDRGEALKKRGWYSFEPYWTFLESLCSPEEWHVHKTYLIESRKEYLGNYHSDYVAALKASHKGEDPRALTACIRRVLDLRNNANHYQVARGRSRRSRCGCAKGRSSCTPPPSAGGDRTMSERSASAFGVK